MLAVLVSGEGQTQVDVKKSFCDLTLKSYSFVVPYVAVPTNRSNGTSSQLITLEEIIDQSMYLPTVPKGLGINPSGGLDDVTVTAVQMGGTSILMNAPGTFPVEGVLYPLENDEPDKKEYIASYFNGVSHTSMVKFELSLSREGELQIATTATKYHATPKNNTGTLKSVLKGWDVATVGVIAAHCGTHDFDVLGVRGVVESVLTLPPLPDIAPGSPTAVTFDNIHDEVIKDVLLTNDVDVGCAEVSLLLALAVMSSSLRGIVEVVSLLLDDQFHLLPSTSDFLGYFRR